jgi:cobalamin biosynthesis protein CbiD
MPRTPATAKSPRIDQATWLEHFQTIAEAKRAHKETGEVLSAAKRAAKDAGMDMQVLKLAEGLYDLDSEEADSRVRDVFQKLEWLGRPLGAQGELFAETAAVPPKKRANGLGVTH